MTRRLVVISTALGHDLVPHAGGRYLVELDRVARRSASVTYLVPGTRINREAAELPGAPEHVIPLGLQPERRLHWKALNRLALILDGRWRRLDPGMPYLPLLVGLLRSRDAREEIRRADVIDLQWSDSIRLVRLVRRLNPDARIVGTFHDVMSQLFAREPAATRWQALGWRVVAWRSRRAEQRMVRALDHVVVFSVKDAELLGTARHLTVVAPPLANGNEQRHDPGSVTPGTAVVVSYLARDENDKAAHWLLDEVWGKVLAAMPEARLRLVGGGVLRGLAERVESDASVVLTGFVPDLTVEYARAAVGIVPVRKGAGVKFKTIEALLNGVPTVTTRVGAEGIDEPALFVLCDDRADEFAGAIIDVLRHPEAHQERADAAQAWASGHFGRGDFEAAITRVWDGTD